MHAPGIVNPNGGAIAGHHLLLSHGMALQAMRALASQKWEGKIGIALNMSAVLPQNLDARMDQEAANLHWDRGYGFFLEALFKGKYPDSVLRDKPILSRYIQKGDLSLISQPFDFLGINYYTRTLVSGRKNDTTIEFAIKPHVPNPHSVLWDFYPEGLSQVVEKIWKLYHPKEILITENGTALDDQLDDSGKVHDPGRIEYIHAHLQEVQKLIRKKIPLTGYFVWSLLDNFEWAEGYSKRFGIIYVDYATLKRTIKSSGHWYTQVIMAKISLTNSL